MASIAQFILFHKEPCRGHDMAICSFDTYDAMTDALRGDGDVKEAIKSIAESLYDHAFVITGDSDMDDYYWVVQYLT